MTQLLRQGGVIVPWGVQEQRGHGTEGRWGWVGLKDLRGFSNLNDSLTLFLAIATDVIPEVHKN